MQIVEKFYEMPQKYLRVLHAANGVGSGSKSSLACSSSKNKFASNRIEGSWLAGSLGSRPNMNWESSQRKQFRFLAFVWISFISQQALNPTRGWPRFEKLGATLATKLDRCRDDVIILQQWIASLTALAFSRKNRLWFKNYCIGQDPVQLQLFLAWYYRIILRLLFFWFCVPWFSYFPHTYFDCKTFIQIALQATKKKKTPIYNEDVLNSVTGARQHHVGTEITTSQSVTFGK